MGNSVLTSQQTLRTPRAWSSYLLRESVSFIVREMYPLCAQKKAKCLAGAKASLGNWAQAGSRTGLNPRRSILNLILGS